MSQATNATWRANFDLASDTSLGVAALTYTPILLSNRPSLNFSTGDDTAEYETCSNGLADRIYEAFEQLEDPKKHTKYDTVEEFLAALDSRIKDH